ncbi:MAG: hypothetical protein R2814_15345 [Flavobacteriaceae bacterium]
MGPLEESSKRLNAQIVKSIGDEVDWLGPRKDIQELMQNRIVLPTFRGRFFQGFVGGIGYGIAHDTTNVPGTNEIIRHLKEGLHVEVDTPKDGPDKAASDSLTQKFGSQCQGTCTTV